MAINATAKRTAKTSVYLCRDGSGAIIYVGIAKSVKARMASHRSKSSWFEDVAEITSIEFANRFLAEEEERRLILTHDPKFNSAKLRPNAKRWQEFMTRNEASEFIRVTGEHDAAALHFRYLTARYKDRCMKRMKREALDAERKAIWEEDPHYNRRRLPPKS